MGPSAAAVAHAAALAEAKAAAAEKKAAAAAAGSSSNGNNGNAANNTTAAAAAGAASNSTNNINKSHNRLIEGYTQTHLLSVAERVVAQKTSNTGVLDAAAEARIPKFQKDGKYGIEVV